MKTLADDECKADILRRLRTLRPESSRRWGRMSAHQMVCHLSDGFRMATGATPVRSARGPLPPTVLKWMALYLPLRWRAGIPTSPEIDQECDGTRPAGFAADVASLEQLLEIITTRETAVAYPRHPLFGRMTRADWLRWAYLHADHHLRQFGA